MQQDYTHQFYKGFELYQKHKHLEAVEFFKILDTHYPFLLQPKLNIAFSLEYLGEWDKALDLIQEVHDKSFHNKPLQDFALHKLGWHTIRKGNFREGMRRIQYGRNITPWGTHVENFEKPMLNPSVDIKGKTILVCAEAGVGDEIINFRFCKFMQSKGARVIYRNMHRGLGSILKRSGGFDEFYNFNDKLKFDYDYWVAGLDLPAILNLNLEDISNEPYIKLDPSYQKKWKKIFDKFESKYGKKKKIGLRWTGDNRVDAEQNRRLSLDFLKSQIDYSDSSLFSLELEHDLEINPLVKYIKTWEDTLHAISFMDEIHSSCTGIVHLAGAFGKKVTVYTPAVPYYIWASDKEKSSWYRDVTIKVKNKDYFYNHIEVS